MDRCDDEAPALPGLRAFWGTKGLRGGRAPLLARERSSLPSNSPPSPQRALSGDGGCVVRCMRKRESPQACGRRERACLRLYGHRQQRATGWRPKAVPVTTKEVTGIDSNARPNGGHRPCPLRRRKLRASTATRDRMAATGRARYDEGSYGHRQQRATEWRPQAVPVTTKEVTGIDSNARPNGGHRPCPLRRRKLRASTATRDRMAATGRARYDEGSYGHRQQRATEWRPAEDVLSFTDRARTASRRRHAI